MKPVTGAIVFVALAVGSFFGTRYLLSRGEPAAPVGDIKIPMDQKFLEGSGYEGVEGGAVEDKQAEQKLADLKKQYEAAKTAYEKERKPGDLETAYVKATVDYGWFTMEAPHLSARVKYKDALRLFREALKLDPDNREAKEASDKIVAIYESMGRPVPES